MRNTRDTVALRYGLLTLFAMAWVGVPIWLVIVNSFKTAGEAARLSLALPSSWAAAENYRTAIVDGDYFHALLNSLIIAVPTILVVVLVGAAAAWAFGRSTSRVMQGVFYVVTLSILIPPSLIPTIYLLRDISLQGTTFGYILVLIGTRMGILVFLATGFIRNMPVDLENAAAIDGANSIQVFVRIILPLLSPVLFVGSIILFIGVWSDFFFATFLIPSQDQHTLPLALYSFATSSVSSFRWNLVFAHVVLTSLPLLVAFVFLQKRVIGGLTEGALKG